MSRRPPARSSLWLGSEPGRAARERDGRGAGELGPGNRQQLPGCAPSGRRQPTRRGSWERGARGPRRTDGSQGGGTGRRAAAAPTPPLHLATAVVRPRATVSGRQRIAAPGRLSASRRLPRRPRLLRRWRASASVFFGTFSIPFFDKHTCVFPFPIRLRRMTPKGAFVSWSLTNFAGQNEIP